MWVTCDSLLKKIILLQSHTHQPIKCKHAFFKYPGVKLWNNTCLQKSPRGGGRVSLSGPWTICNPWNSKHRSRTLSVKIHNYIPRGLCCGYFESGNWGGRGRKMSFSHSYYNLLRYLVRWLSPQYWSSSRIGSEKMF